MLYQVKIGIISLSKFIDKEVGVKRTKKCNKYDEGYDTFKLGVHSQISIKF